MWEASQAAGHDAALGWNALVGSLLRAGAVDEARERAHSSVFSLYADCKFRIWRK